METGTARCVGAVEFGDFIHWETAMWWEGFAPLFPFGQDNSLDGVLIAGADIWPFAGLVVGSDAWTAFGLVVAGQLEAWTILGDL